MPQVQVLSSRPKEIDNFRQEVVDFFCTFLFSLFSVLFSLTKLSISDKGEKRRDKRNSGFPCEKHLYMIYSKQDVIVMKNSPLLDKSLELATMIVLFYDEYSKSKKDTTIPKQLLRSGTSVGANLNEAIYGNSKADFISKLHISLKEVGESIYWLKLLERTNIFEYNYQEMISLAEEIRRMLIASLNTAKNKN